MAKFKYLRITTKPKRPMGLTDIVAQVDVNHLNKKGIEAEWNKLDVEYPKERYVSSLVTVDREMRVFKDKPIKD